jgi:copper(I)-binding protein
MKIVIRIFLFSILSIFFMPLIGAETKINISHPWIREAHPNAEVLAGYMEINNQSPHSQILVGARSVDFKSVMLHQSITKEGMTHMNHAKKIEIKAGTTLQFSQSGFHLMLMNPKKIIKQGDKIQILLEFGDGRVLAIDFTVRKEHP